MQAQSPIQEIRQYRELLGMLAWRDVRVRYKHSFLGAAWAVAPPLMTMLIFVFAFGHVMGLDNATLTGRENIPYALFALTGLIPWTFFTNGLTGALNSLVGNRSLLTKIYFPREVFPIATILAAGIDFLVSLALLAVIAAGFHVFTPWQLVVTPSILLLPAAMLIQAALMIGVGFFLAMGNLYYRDVGFIFRAMIPLLMFVTNVIYPLESSTPWINRLIHLNPMVPVLSAYRAAIMPDITVSGMSLAYSAIVATLLLVSGWSLFHRCEYSFAERV